MHFVTKIFSRLNFPEILSLARGDDKSFVDEIAEISGKTKVRLCPIFGDVEIWRNLVPYIAYTCTRSQISRDLTPTPS